MRWLIITLLAIPLGWLTSLVTRRYGMGPVVCLPIAVLGAWMGGALTLIIFEPSMPGYMFYGISLLMSILALGGGSFAFLLTGSERRV